MSVLMQAALLALVFVEAALATERSPAQRAAFVRDNPCPSTQAARDACPGWVVDHVVPLCAGGADHPANMQWQTKAEAKAKDADEHRQCRRLRERAADAAKAP